MKVLPGVCSERRHKGLFNYLFFDEIILTIAILEHLLFVRRLEWQTNRQKYSGR